MFGIHKTVDLQPEEFKAKLEEGQGIVIDCRTADEVAEGCWPNAVHADWLSGEFQNYVETQDRDKSYFLYCRSGSRSNAAAGLMRQMGFAKVYNVGGLNDIAPLLS